MQAYQHLLGRTYRILEGVRRAKAAQLGGIAEIQAEVIDAMGKRLGFGLIPIAALRSPKDAIRRVTPADETRWNRVVNGTQQPVLPFPPILVEVAADRGTKIEDVGFDFGDDS